MKKFDCVEQLLLDGYNDKPIAKGCNFVIKINGSSYGIKEGILPVGTSAGIKNFKFVSDRTEGNVYSKEYEMIGEGTSKGTHLAVTVRYESFGKTGAIRQTVTVKNIGDENTVLTQVSSAEIEGLGADGLLPWYSKDRFILHTCDTIWQGECQWRRRTFSELGLVPTTTHINGKSIEIASVGSWTTGRNYPIVIIEDTETGRSFYLELEPAGAWQISIFNPSKGFASDGVIGIEANCANIHHDGWELTLAPGEEYASRPVVYGTVCGGFEEAIAELIAYKRATSRTVFKGRIPVTYNTYMNGIWSMPTSETLIPLIDACSKAGVDIFCIDAGWFRCFDDPSKNAIGDYNIAEDRFPGYGLKGIFDYMVSKKLTPGIWIEAECCQEGVAYKLADNCLVERHNKPVGGTRAFFNFREQAVRDHIMSVIDRLYSMGVRFIKNDYNQSTGIGFSNYGEAYSKEATDSLLAFTDFIDSVKAKYPDLMIENCGSGGMREDNGMLAHFDLQSTSDQELFYRYPSVASGSIACMPPEKAGIWSYPYPVLNPEQGKAADREFWDKRITEWADGEETVFNMVGAMLGNMYMSGRIDKCDKYNASLIKEAIKLYKSYGGFIKTALPCWPAGTFAIDDEGMFCTGLVDRKKGKLLLAIWNINAHKKTAVFDVSKWASNNSSARIVYPANDEKAVCVFNGRNKKLSVKLPDAKYSARLIEISLA